MKVKMSTAYKIIIAFIFIYLVIFLPKACHAQQIKETWQLEIAKEFNKAYSVYQKDMDEAADWFEAHEARFELDTRIEIILYNYRNEMKEVIYQPDFKDKYEETNE